MSELKDTSHWDFVLNRAADAEWTTGLREIFEYRDVGVKAGTKGDVIAHVIRHKGVQAADDVQQWHIHECDFQLVYVIKGWAEFEFEGEGVKRMEAGDVILQKPMIKHREIAISDDYEVLEIVSPADFATKIVDAPEQQSNAAE